MPLGRELRRDREGQDHPGFDRAVAVRPVLHHVPVDADDLRAAQVAHDLRREGQALAQGVLVPEELAREHVVDQDRRRAQIVGLAHVAPAEQARAHRLEEPG